MQVISKVKDFLHYFNYITLKFYSLKNSIKVSQKVLWMSSRNQGRIFMRNQRKKT